MSIRKEWFVQNQRAGYRAPLLTVALACLAFFLSSAPPVDRIRFFSYDGTYVGLNQRFEIGARGNIWDTLSKDANAQSREQLKPILRRAIWRVWPDYEKGRDFFLIGDRMARQFDAMLVLDAKNLGFLGLTPQQMDKELDEPRLVVSRAAEKIYLSFSAMPGKDTPVGNYRTRVFNYDTIAPTGSIDYREGQILIRQNSCLFGDGRYLLSGQQVFDVRAGLEVRKTSLFGKTGYVAANCESGHLLLLSKSAGDLTALSIFDVIEDRIILDVASGVPWAGFTSAGWSLVPGAQTVVYEETHRAPVGQGYRLAKTGKLVFLDALAGVKRGETRIPIDTSLYSNGVLGFSPDGETLAYRSGSKVFFVSLVAPFVTRKVVLPFEPMSVVWQ